MPERTGDAIVGFGGETDAAPLRQRLHRPVDDVAGVIGAAQVDDRWLHGQGRGIWGEPCPKRAGRASGLKDNPTGARSGQSRIGQPGEERGSGARDRSAAAAHD